MEKSRKIRYIPSPLASEEGRKFLKMLDEMPYTIPRDKNASVILFGRPVKTTGPAPENESSQQHPGDPETGDTPQAGDDAGNS